MKYISVTEDGAVQLFNNTPEFLKSIEEDVDNGYTHYQVGDEVTVKTGIKIRKVKAHRTDKFGAPKCSS
jgi:hypothetical protein